MRESVSDQRLSEALNYLSQTDEQSARLKADVERQEYRFKRTKALAFKLAEGTVADRTATAETAADTGEAAERWFQAIQDSEGVRARRQTEALIVEVWRSVQANRRTGNI